MEQFLAELSQVLIAYENAGSAGLGIIGSIVFFLKSKRAREFALKYLFYNHKMEDGQDCQGQYSQLMAQIKYWESQKEQLLVYADKGRQQIFQDLTQIKVKALKTRIEQIYEMHTRGELRNPKDILNAVLEHYATINTEIVKEQKHANIPEVQIDSFMMWQRVNFRFSINQLETIINSGAHHSTEQKLEGIFNILKANMAITIQETEKSLDRLNGELTGQVYKGVTCGH